MKRGIIAAAVLLAAALGLAACGQREASAAQEQPQEAPGSGAYMANPWRDCTEAEAEALCTPSLRVPDGAQNVHWSVMEGAADPSGVPGALVQLKFDLDGNSFTAREQITGGDEVDHSGMYYTWTAQSEGVLKDTPCRCYRSVGEAESAELCLWHDGAAGVSYSLSVVAKDLDGFDLQAVAEALHP